VNAIHSPIAPHNPAEARLIEQYEHDLRNSDAAYVGPLVRRGADGKLVRLPDLPFGHTFDAQVACDLFVLGHGPGKDHGVACWWIDIARRFRSWPLADQRRAVKCAKHNWSLHHDGPPPATRFDHLLEDDAPAAPVAPVRRGGAACSFVWA